MKPTRILAVDLGASGGKCFAGLFENDEFVMREVHRFEHEAVPLFVPDDTGRLAERLYWDDLALYGEILKGLREYRRQIGPTLDSIGIDAWGADGQFMGPDGELLGKVYAYRDHRLDGMMAEVCRRISRSRIYQITGIHFQPFNVSNQLYWFVRHRRRVLRQGAFYLPIPSLFYYYLGGVRMVDSTWASVTQLMDARTKRWSETILRRLRIPAEVMPPIVAPGTVVGSLYPEIAEAVGVTRARLTAVGSHDTACAFAAAPIENAAEALIISSGTWSLLGRLVAEPVTTAAAMQANLSNEGGLGNVRLLKNCMGSWLVQELRRAWRNEDGKEQSWEELNRLAAEATPFAAFIDPDDPQFYNPPNMAAALRQYCERTGQRAPVDRGAMVRTVYESLALKYRAVNEEIEQVSGTRTQVIHVVGGGCRNEMLNQFTAEATGLPVLVGPEEATATGNLMTQAVALGVLSSWEEALAMIRRTFPLRTYHPREAPKWAEAYRRFKECTRERR